MEAGGLRMLTTRFEDAIRYACHIHASDVRKGTEIPYVAHLLAVASLVVEDGGSEDEAIAALLHDAAEDQGGRRRLDDIRTRFGESVARIVDGCTDTCEDPKPPWRGRKERYLSRLQDEPPDVLRVSLADKLHNARAILRDFLTYGDDLWRRFNAARDDQLWYQQSLREIFLERSPGPMATEFARVVSELEDACGVRP